MGKIGTISISGRKIFSVGRSIVSANPQIVIFSDGSSINLNTWVITNLSPDLLLALDTVPDGYQMPEKPKPEERRYISNVLRVEGIDRSKVVIEPHDGTEIVIPAFEGIESSLKNDIVTVTLAEPDQGTTIRISNVSGVSIVAGSISIGSIFKNVFSGIGNVLSFTDEVSSADLKILVPFGTQIGFRECENVVVGDTDGTITVVSDDDVTLRTGKLKEIVANVTGDLSLTTTNKQGSVVILSEGDVRLTNPHGCNKLIITASGDVDVVCNDQSVTGNITIKADSDADVRLPESLGNVKITVSGDVKLKAVKVIGNIDINCDGDVDVSLQGLDGDASITADGDLDMSIDSGKVGKMTTMVDGDADVTIKTTIESIKAVVDGDGTFRIQCITGFQRIKVEGDDDIEIG